MRTTWQSSYQERPDLTHHQMRWINCFHSMRMIRLRGEQVLRLHLVIKEANRQSTIRGRLRFWKKLRKKSTRAASQDRAPITLCLDRSSMLMEMGTYLMLTSRAPVKNYRSRQTLNRFYTRSELWTQIRKVTSTIRPSPRIGVQEWVKDWPS